MNNIQNYLKKIGYDKQPKVDLDTLAEIHRCHAFNIPFENFDVFLNDGVDIQKSIVLDKIVDNKRGGYCYELNGSLYDLLAAIGFKVKYLVSRPMLGYEAIRPKTHMMLMIDLDGEQYLADVGFTSLNIIEPIPIKPNIEHEQFGFHFRIIEDNERGFIFQSKSEGKWESCYSFDLSENQYIDYKLANFFNSHSPESICTNIIIVGKYFENGRIRLINNNLEIRLNDRNEDVKVGDKGHLSLLLDKYFGIVLDFDQLNKIYNKMEYFASK